MAEHEVTLLVLTRFPLFLFSLHPNRSVQLPPQPAEGLLLPQHPVQTGKNKQVLLVLMAEAAVSRALVTFVTFPLGRYVRAGHAVRV